MTEQAETIAEIERIVLASGACVRTAEVEFSRDGETWSSVFAPAHEGDHPEFVRASCQRAGMIEPTRVVLSWAEAIPIDEQWHGLWLARPMALAGGRARRDVYRRAFRDIVDIVANGHEGDDVAALAEPEPVAPRDWIAEIHAAPSSSDLEDLWAEVKRRKEHRRPVVFAAYMERRGELEGAAGIVALAEAVTAPKVDEAELEAAVGRLAEVHTVTPADVAQRVRKRGRR